MNRSMCGCQHPVVVCACTASRRTRRCRVPLAAGLDGAGWRYGDCPGMLGHSMAVAAAGPRWPAWFGLAR
jgi:hypothetical protein